MKQIFLEDFANADDVYRHFDEDPGKEHILLAWYGYGNYSGAAFVVFELDGKLYEINGSHCSCYGLEGQWDPEETTVKALRYRMTQGALGHGDDWYSGSAFGGQLEECLKEFEKEFPEKPVAIDYVI